MSLILPLAINWLHIHITLTLGKLSPNNIHSLSELDLVANANLDPIKHHPCLPHLQLARIVLHNLYLTAQSGKLTCHYQIWYRYPNYAHFGAGLVLEAESFGWLQVDHIVDV